MRIRNIVGNTSGILLLFFLFLNAGILLTCNMILLYVRDQEQRPRKVGPELENHNFKKRMNEFLLELPSPRAHYLLLVVKEMQKFYNLEHSRCMCCADNIRWRDHVGGHKTATVNRCASI